MYFNINGKCINFVAESVPLNEMTVLYKIRLQFAVELIIGITSV
jgi:hypothetical protein